MIRVYVGCAANGEDAESQAVLEYSIRKHASEPVDITWMRLSRDPASPFYCDGAQGWATDRWATPFSGFRWAIPWLCDFQGRAIYMDSDVIVMADLAELWHQPFEPGRWVMAKGAEASWRYCVSLWNCEAAPEQWRRFPQARSNPDLHRQMTQVMRSHPQWVQPFGGNWNCLDGEKYESLAHPDIKAIHYTSMRHQPHHRHAAARLAQSGRKHWFDGDPAPHWRPDLVELFDGLLEEAEAAGYGVARYDQVELFGEYRKASVAGQGRSIPAWGR